MISSNLKCSQQCIYAYKKATRVLGMIIKRRSRYHTMNQRLHLIFTRHWLGHVEYSTCAWKLEQSLQEGQGIVREDTTQIYNKNSSGDKIANVNFLTTISHTRRPTSKYRKRDKPTSFNKIDDR